MPKERTAFDDFVHRLQYLALRLASMVMHSFPVGLNLRAARLLGDVLYFIDKRHRDVAIGNLRRSFPGHGEAFYRRHARLAHEAMVMLGVEVLFTTRLIHFDTWSKYVELENFRDVVGLLTRRDRGLLLLTGHYGNWEILGYVLGTLGFETVSVARPLDNPYVNQWLLGVRERQGQRIIAKKGATADVTEALDGKGAVGFIADQNAGSKGIFVEFFGRKASTYKSIGLLAMTYEVPVVVGYARRVGADFRFRVGVQDVIYPADWKDQDDPLRYITQRYTTAIENMVRAEPGQYLWLHRRWKTRPKGEPPETYG